MPNKKSKKGKGKSKATTHSESRYSVINYLTSLDIFGVAVPQFKIKGKDKVQTVFGGFLSALVITVTFGFAIIGFHDLYTRADPTINSYSKQSYYQTEEDGLDLSKTNQRLAVAIYGNNYETKYDPKYVRLAAYYYDDGGDGFSSIPFH